MRFGVVFPRCNQPPEWHGSRRSRSACPVSRLSSRLRPPAFRTRREPGPQGSPPTRGQPVRWSRTWRRQLNQHGRLQQARQSPPGHLLPLRGCWDSSRRHAECPASPRAAHPGPPRRPEAPRRNRGRRIRGKSPALSSISRFFFSAGMAVSSPVSIAAPIISKATLEDSSMNESPLGLVLACAKGLGSAQAGGVALLKLLGRVERTVGTHPDVEHLREISPGRVLSPTEHGHFILQRPERCSANLGAGGNSPIRRSRVGTGVFDGPGGAAVGKRGGCVCRRRLCRCWRRSRRISRPPAVGSPPQAVIRTVNVKARADRVTKRRLTGNVAS